MMKLLITLLVVFTLLNISGVFGAGISHYSSSGGGKAGVVSQYLKELKDSQKLTPKQRYDWSWCRLYIRDENTGYESYTDFHPRVDEFTSLRVPGTNKSVIFNPYVSIWMQFPGNKSYTTYQDEMVDCAGNTTIPGCESGQTQYLKQTVVTTYTPITTQPKKVYDEANDAIVNFFTVIVELDQGTITDANWDGDRDTSICKDCAKCIDNQCAVKPSTMKCDDPDIGGCNLKIFLAWNGKDSKKKPCISIGKIPSAFRKYSATPLSQLGMGLADDFLARVVGNTNNPRTA